MIFNLLIFFWLFCLIFCRLPFPYITFLNLKLFPHNSTLFLLINPFSNPINPFPNLFLLRLTLIPRIVSTTLLLLLFCNKILQLYNLFLQVLYLHPRLTLLFIFKNIFFVFVFMFDWSKTNRIVLLFIIHFYQITMLDHFHLCQYRMTFILSFTVFNLWLG